MKKQHILTITSLILGVFLAQCSAAQSLMKSDLANNLTSNTNLKTDNLISGGQTGSEDHFLQPDDFFIAREPYKGEGYLNVYLAKQITPPSAQTKNEAKFMQVHEGKEIWAKTFWSTRKINTAEIKIGQVVICFESSHDGVYVAPSSKDQARNGSWFMAKITDVSDTFKGNIMVSGGYKISVNNLRVAK